MRAALVLLAFFLTGCAGLKYSGDEAGPIARLVEAMAKDPATACLNIVSSFGTVRLTRSNPTVPMTVRCSPDGELSITLPAGPAKAPQ